MNRLASLISGTRAILSLASIAMFLLFVVACSKDDASIVLSSDPDGTSPTFTTDNALPPRDGPRPETTESVPHVQIDVQLVPDVHDALVKKIYAIPGVHDRPSAVASWRGILINDHITVLVSQALISGREFGHIHDDGSLHIFLEPERAQEAVDTGWAIFHPFALTGDERWQGFVMLYTPQSHEEADITYQLILEAFDYITGSGLRQMDG